MAHECPDCGRTFAAAQALGVHRARAHGVRHGDNGSGRQAVKKAPTARRQAAVPSTPAPAATTSALNTEEAIRADERAKLADLLDEHGAALTVFTPSGEKMLALIVHLLRLG